MYKDEIIVVRFDEEMLKGFTGYDKSNPKNYFQDHPRAKKPPMESLWGKTRVGLVPSINKFLDCSDRVLQSTWEKHLCDYCEYCMKRQGIKHDYIEECIIVTISYRPTRAKADVNNIYVKPFIDAMVERELLKEDNYTVVKYHAEYIVIDKEDPRTEIRIYPITKEYDFMCAITEAMNDVVELNDKYNN